MHFLNFFIFKTFFHSFSQNYFHHLFFNNIINFIFYDHKTLFLFISFSTHFHIFFFLQISILFLLFIDFDPYFPSIELFMWTFQYHFNAIAFMQKKSHTILFLLEKRSQKSAKEINVRLIPLSNNRRLRETEEKRKREEKTREEMHNIRIERNETITCVYATIRRFSSKCKQISRISLSFKRENETVERFFISRCVELNDQRGVFVKSRKY